MLLVAAMASMSGSAGAALIVEADSRFIYDDVLDVTWLRDANFARTSGYSSTGAMTWADADAWVDSLSFTVDGRTVDHWRLPHAVESGGTAFAYDGSTSWGYNITRPSSELAHLFYVTLGNKGYYDTSGNIQGGVYGLLSRGPFENVQVFRFGGGYWSDTASSANPTRSAWAFNHALGSQSLSDQTPLLTSDWKYAWAVHDGRVTAVPEPAEWTILAAGLLATAASARLRRARAGEMPFNGRPPERHDS